MSNSLDSLRAKLTPIFGRRSIRAYGADGVDDAVIQALLEAAMAAPSAVAKDPWRFIVVRDRKMLGELTLGLPNAPMLGQASLAVVVCGDLAAAHDQQLGYMIQDCAAAIENMLLAAHILGLGGCWLGIYPREDRVRFVSDKLGVPEGVIPLAAVSLGLPGETKEPRTRFNALWVHHERW